MIFHKEANTYIWQLYSNTFQIHMFQWFFFRYIFVLTPINSNAFVYPFLDDGSWV